MGQKIICQLLNSSRKVGMNMNNTTIKNWVDDTPMAGTYVIRNIRFELDGKPINECLHATQFTWKQLMQETADGDDKMFSSEYECLLAYYRMQAFMYFDCKFDVERVKWYREPGKHEQIIAINNELTEQPYNYGFELGLNYQTTDELVEIEHPTTWLAVIPDGFELAMTYLHKPHSTELQSLAVYEYLLNTLPFTVYTKQHRLVTDVNIPEL